MAFKDVLKDLREELSLSQKEVAKECGLSPQCISQLETGMRNPTGSTLLALSDFFDCSIDYLMGKTHDYDSLPSIESFSRQSRERNELISIYNSIPPEFQAQILEYARYISARSNSQTKNTVANRNGKK